MNIKEIFRLTGIPVLLASLCCLSPLIFLGLGIITLSAATEITDIFYGTYKWAFRGVGFLAFIFTLWYYFKSKGICTINQLKRQRNKVISTILIAFTLGVLGYIFFLYVVVHYLGKWVGAW